MNAADIVWAQEFFSRPLTSSHSHGAWRDLQSHTPARLLKWQYVIPPRVRPLMRTKNEYRLAAAHYLIRPNREFNHNWLIWYFDHQNIDIVTNHVLVLFENPIQGFAGFYIRADKLKNDSYMIDLQTYIHNLRKERRNA